MVNNGQGSPAIANSTPYGHQNSMLPTLRNDPRATSPAHSPAPIPQPPASGGKPPSGLHGQGNGLVFGSSGAENGDFRSSQGPLTPGSQPAHLRRESSQSSQSDMSGAGMGRGFMPPNGRGRGFIPPYGNQSPAQGYRQMSNSRGPPNMPGQFQGQQMTNSPYRGRNSPAMMPAQPHMPQGMPPQMPYGGYPQGHLGPGQYMYGMQPYDPSAGYYPPYYPSHPGYQGAPPSPRNAQFSSPYGGPPAHQQSPYHPPSMSRSGSQVSERPASSLGSRPPTNAGGHSQANTPAPGAQSTPTSSNFQIPTRAKSKAIVIKNAAGEEVHFDKKAASPAPAAAAAAAATAATPVAAPSAPVPPPQSPAIVSSAPTPPPRTPSTASNSRVEIRSAKTDAEIKNGFQEQVKRQIEAQKEAERKLKEGSDAKSGVEKSAEVKPTETQPEEAKSAEAKPAEAKPTEAKSAEAKPADATPSEDKVAEEKSKAEQLAKEAAAKSDAEAAAQADNARAVTEAENAAASKKDEEDEAARLKREEDERIEREIAEMEAAEREEEERERAYQEKRNKAAEEKKKREAEVAANADAEMKRMEREAEELEAKREREREQGESTADSADKELFASLKRPTLGPGATAEATEEASSSEPTATAEETATTPTAETAAPARSGQKPKPASLKLRTDKPVEPAQPTPGMQALKSARLLDIQRESITYPNGIQSPNPALNQAGKQRGRQYDKTFLLQFQEVFKEKPTIDWDQKVKDTLGDGEPGSARPQSSRQNSVSMGGRQPSNRGSATAPGYSGPMGSFGGPRTLPPGTSSMDRFNASNSGMRPVPGIGGFSSGRPGAFPMGQSVSRGGSLQPMGQGNAPPSPRPGASRGKGSRRGPDRAMSRKEEEQQNKAMPLTAAGEVKALEKSQTGWTARSIGQPLAAAAVAVDGSMPPDMVQRKVKAALNKMTPEKFEKISDQIMEIANQSKNETDGRTLRQVIQLTFEKACDEAHWAGMYAKFCQKMLTSMSNDIVDDTITKNGQPVTGGGLFRKYLLNRCQEEFERGWEANLPEKPEGETEEAALLSDEYYVMAAAKRRGLGLIQFIGELYKLGMLTYRIMHRCVMRLLDFEGQPDESSVENLCRLLRTVGATMDNSDEQGHGLVVAYFDRINNILDQNKDMASRPRFMLMDVIDLRKHGWQDKAAAKGPKTIQEIHAEAEAAQAAQEAERARTSQRGGRPPAGRGDARSFSSQGMPPPDYSRNEVNVSDLRRLQNRNVQPRTASSGLGPSLGPGSSLYAGRSGSGRKGLGPPRDGDASGNTSRTSTPPMKKEDKEPSAQANSFSALAALENEGAEATARSPPSEKASPAVTKAVPSIDAASDAPNGA